MIIVVVTVMPEIGVTEIIAMAQAETVVNRNAITSARMTEMKVSQVPFSMSRENDRSEEHGHGDDRQRDPGS